MNGQKRALLKVKVKKCCGPVAKDVVNKNIINTKQEVEKIEPFTFPAKTVNDLARLKFKEQLLKEILVDLMICEIEGWNKIEYIEELQKLLNGIDVSNKQAE